MPKVSVIMGIYNCAPTLQEALDSLYAQTFQDFEIILCDDGSTDDTHAIAYKNQQEHRNVVLLKNPNNMGLNQTLNNCLDVARGKYIARMDGDDISLPERFATEVKFLDEHPEYAIVSCPMIYFDENGEVGRGNSRETMPTKNAFNYGPPFCHAPCMVRKEAYLDVGGYSVDSKLLRMEDYNLWMKMYALGYRGYNIPQYLYLMRDDAKAIRRRTLQNRINGIYAHYLAYKVLNLSLYRLLVYSFVNILKWIVPECVYKFFHTRKYKKK